MERGPFGRTGLEVSALGLGCWEIGGGYGAIEADQFARAVGRALDLGINCFDTAEAYGFGRSESELARALGSRRKEAIIVTKVGVGYPDAPGYRDASRARILKSVESSLENLKTDYIDVYLVHWPDVNTPFEETMRALDDLVRQGKVRAVGVSNFRRVQLEKAAQTRRIDVAQYGWNLFDRRMGRAILPYCQENGTGVMAYGSLAYGLLSGTLDAATRFEKGDWRARGGSLGKINLARTVFGPEHFERNLRAVEALRAIASGYGKTLPQLALRWVTAHPAVSVALVGCRTPEEVEENAGAVGWKISDADLAEIDRVFARHGIDTAPDTWIEDDGLEG